MESIIDNNYDDNFNMDYELDHKEYTNENINDYIQKINNILDWIKEGSIDISGIVRIKKNLEIYKENLINYNEIKNSTLRRTFDKIDLDLLKIETVKKIPNVKYIDKIFKYYDDYDDIYNCTINIIGENGDYLIKIINDKNLTLDDHLTTLTEYIEYGKQNQVNWENPAIIYKFNYKIDDDILEELQNFGIYVWEYNKEFNLDIVKPKLLDYALIDKNIVMILCSDFTNGSINYNSQNNSEYYKKQVEYIKNNLQKILKQKNILHDKLKSMRKIYITRLIYNNVIDVMKKMGNDNENKRFIKFMEDFNVEIIDFNVNDVTFNYGNEISNEYINMLECAKSKKLYIFSANKITQKVLKNNNYKVNTFICPLVILAGY